MSKARTVRIEGVEVESAEEEAAREAAELADLNEEEDGELFRVTEELRAIGAGVQLLVTRTYPNTPDMAGYVGEMTLSEYDPEELYNRYGPGRYKVRLRGRNGFIKGGGAVHIAKRATPPSGGGGGTSGGDFATYLRTVQERDAAAAARRDRYIELAIPGAITLLAAVLGRAPAQGPDIATLVTALKPAPGPSLTDLTAALANMKTLSGGDKAEPSQIENFLNILEKVKDLAGNDKGESNWTDVVRDVIREGLPAVKPLLENLQAQQQARMGNPLPPMSVVPISGPTGSIPSTASNVGVTPSPMAASASSTNSGGDPDMMAFAGPLIRAQCEKLAQWAQEKKRVELYAEVLLEELPAIVHQYVTPAKALEYLNHPQWFEILKAQDPRLSAHLGWCDAMRREVIEIIQEQIDEAAGGKPPPQVIDPVNGDSPE